MVRVPIWSWGTYLRGQVRDTITDLIGKSGSDGSLLTHAEFNTGETFELVSVVQYVAMHSRLLKREHHL